MLPKYSRRSFLIAAGISAVSAPFLARRGLELLRAAPEVFVSARTDVNGNHYIGGFTPDGADRFSIEVDLRCHGVAVHPVTRARAVVFTRRPGTLAYEIDFLEGVVRNKITSPPGRHFFGHGAYSSDGRYLFCSEQEYDRGRGIVAIYDGATLRRLGEIPSFGIGPHEVRMLNDGKTLVVANGGIRTHPSSGRKKLNLDTMKPALAYVDTATGALKGEYHLSDNKLSIRHLSVAGDDRVGIAMQYQGAPENDPPLIAFHQGEEKIVTASSPDYLTTQMKNYTASICIEPNSGVTCVTSPKGNLVTFWQSKTVEFLNSLPISDAGGVSLSRDNSSFIITTGRGEIHTVSVASRRPGTVTFFPNTKWDNHLTASV